MLLSRLPVEIGHPVSASRLVAHRSCARSATGW